MRIPVSFANVVRLSRHALFLFPAAYPPPPALFSLLCLHVRLPCCFYSLLFFLVEKLSLAARRKLRVHFIWLPPLLLLLLLLFLLLLLLLELLQLSSWCNLICLFHSCCLLVPIVAAFLFSFCGLSSPLCAVMPACHLPLTSTPPLSGSRTN